MLHILTENFCFVTCNMLLIVLESF